jgi:hypothetical protein
MLTQESYEKLLRQSLYKRIQIYCSRLPENAGITGHEKQLLLQMLLDLPLQDYRWGMIYAHPIEIMIIHLVDGTLSELETNTQSYKNLRQNLKIF